MTQASAGQKKQERLKALEGLEYDLQRRDFGSDSGTYALATIVEELVSILKKG